MQEEAAKDAYRVLIVDDFPAIHEDFRKILHGEDDPRAILRQFQDDILGEDNPMESSSTFRVESAFQGQGGIEHIRQSYKDNDPVILAFIDVRMPPRIDGIETSSKIQKEFPETQIAICTAFNDFPWPKIAKQMYRADNFVILKKPFENIAILQLAHALCAKWKLAKKLRRRAAELESELKQFRGRQ
jgi:DNA-binding NtrC family response regulator